MTGSAPAPALLRTRILALDNPTSPQALDRLPVIEGLEQLRLMPHGQSLEVRYDLRRLTLAELAAHLNAAGMRLSRRPLDRWHRAWAGFTDENRRDQARLVHQCCNLPPK